MCGWKAVDACRSSTAPPQFDPPAYLDFIDRLLTGNFRQLCLTHFGPVTNVEFHLRQYQERIEEVHRKVPGWMKRFDRSMKWPRVPACVRTGCCYPSRRIRDQSGS